jgi:hypothetical protein
MGLLCCSSRRLDRASPWPQVDKQTENMVTICQVYTSNREKLSNFPGICVVPCTVTKDYLLASCQKIALQDLSENCITGCKRPMLYRSTFPGTHIFFYIPHSGKLLRSLEGNLFIFLRAGKVFWSLK